MDSDSHTEVGREPASLLAKRLDRAGQRIAELELALAVTGMYDPRTGARSRNSLLDAIEYQLRWNARHQTTFGLVVARLGAETDAAHAAAAVAASLRATDIVASWDDWTIGILLPGVTPERVPVPWRRIRPHLDALQAVAVFALTDASADDMLLAGEDPAWSPEGVSTLTLA